eukprot:7585786-Pyramimonas_sp.AAC.1
MPIYSVYCVVGVVVAGDGRASQAADDAPQRDLRAGSGHDSPLGSHGRGVGHSPAGSGSGLETLFRAGGGHDSPLGPHTAAGSGASSTAASGYRVSLGIES